MSRSGFDAASPLYARTAAEIDDAASTKSGSTTYTTASSGTKRKRVVEPKFYSVRVGHRPGIYHTWNECLSQVKGFKNATFKSFPSLIDAERFMAGEDPAKGAGTSSSPYKFYAVRSGRVPGIYTDWPSAQKQIIGWTKPKHKCFSTRAEAQRFLGTADTRPSTDETETQGPENGIMMGYPNLDGHEPYASEPQSKKSKKPTSAAQGMARTSKMPSNEYNPEDYEPGTGLFPPGAEDGFDPNIILCPRTGNVVYKTQAQREATKLQAIRPTTDHMLRVHTDGSSLRNGQDGAFAGVGVFFGPNDERNVSEALPGPRQTNQRAELTAILRALDSIPRSTDVTIVTDSRYAIDCVTLWHTNWRRNGWKTSTGKVVENRDLVESILSRMEERGSLQTRTTFEWIKGHANHPGNVEADSLAVTGARRAAGHAE
ncbi:hypothetical protein MMC26_007413 [Xylographa opegraphella]|nr:hypothetical protein [Xylographa opegraphella]